METATLGGGCFWCLEAFFRNLRGVERVRSGYSGGSVADPSYREVCTGTTGHAEVVQLEFEPSETSYREILEVFFATHDPTTLNRQGADVGTQYRSVIFFHSPEQRAVAQTVMEELARESIWDNPIVTELAPFSVFYPAEEYHEDYFGKNPQQPYCQAVISPKMTKFRAGFAHKLKGRTG